MKPLFFDFARDKIPCKTLRIKSIGFCSSLKNKGMSLIEVLVTMILFSMILVAFTSLSVGVDKVIEKALIDRVDLTEDLSKNLTLKCDDIFQDLRVDKSTGEITQGHDLTFENIPYLKRLQKGEHRGYRIDRITVGTLRDGKRYGLLLDQNKNFNSKDDDIEESVMHIPLNFKITPDGSPPYNQEYHFKVIYDHTAADNEDKIAYCSASKIVSIKECKKKDSILVYKNGVLRCIRTLNEKEEVKDSDYLMVSREKFIYLPCHPLRYSKPKPQNPATGSGANEISEIDFSHQYQDWKLDEDTNKYTNSSNDDSRYNLFEGSPVRYSSRNERYSYERHICKEDPTPIEAGNFACDKKDIRKEERHINAKEVLKADGRKFSVEEKVYPKKLTDNSRWNLTEKPHPPPEGLHPNGPSGSHKYDHYCATALIGFHNGPGWVKEASLVYNPDHKNNIFNNQEGIKGVTIFVGDYTSQSKGHIRFKTQVPAYHRGLMDKQVSLSLFQKEGKEGECLGDGGYKLLRTSMLLNLRKNRGRRRTGNMLNQGQSDGHSSYLIASHDSEKDQTYCYKLVARIISDKFRYGNGELSATTNQVDNPMFLGTIIGDRGRFLSQGFVEFTEMVGFKNE